MPHSRTGTATSGLLTATFHIIGAPVGAGIPEERARTYEADIQSGNIVLVVAPRNELDAEIIERDWAPYAVTILH